MPDYSRLYLSIILGENVNVKFANPDERYKYKRDYETFKTHTTYVILLLLTCSFFLPHRAIDALVNFLMVWYYCTLTIREAILKINGSRIKGWWVLHHYIACALCAITLTWRDGPCYQSFRPWFIIVLTYIGVLQIMQSYYQTAVLRRLYALGQRFEMDVTLEGFSSWMFKGLSFLLPFLIVGYLIQAYCSYYLFNMYFRGRDDCSDSEDWHMLGLAVFFFVVSCGNMITIISVSIRKFFQLKSSDDNLSHLATKYQTEKSD